jgi:hypothetical protein
LAKAKGRGKRPRQKADKFCFSFLFHFDDDNNKMADNNKKVDDGEEGKNSKVLLRLLDFIKGDLALFKRNMTRGRDQFYQQLGRERDPHCRRLIL